MTVAAVVPARFRIVDFPDREAWLQARAGLGVGSSESPALFSRPDNPLAGLSSWESPMSLSYRKRGLAPPKEERQEEADNQEWGLLIEPQLAAWFSKKVLCDIAPFHDVVDPGQYAICLPAEGDPLAWFATVDRLIVPGGAGVEPARLWPDEAVAVLELKNASAWMAGEWNEEPPLIYQLQVQHQLGVTGLAVGYICASIGGEAPRWARIQRDEKVIEILRRRIARFWSSLVAGEDPPVDAHDETARAILGRWPQDSGERIRLDDSMQGIWDERVRLHQEILEREQRKQLATNILKHAIGEASLADLPDGRLLSLKTDRAGRRNLKEINARG